MGYSKVLEQTKIKVKERNSNIQGTLGQNQEPKQTECIPNEEGMKKGLKKRENQTHKTRNSDENEKSLEVGVRGG